MSNEKTAELDERIKKDCGNIAGMVVLKDGKKLYENYFNGCDEGSRIHVFSVTKSIISILIGIAVDKGYIGSPEQKVLDFFPDYTVKKREKTIQSVRLKDLMTMTAPYKYRSAPYIRYFQSGDWVKFSLDLLGGRGQRGQFNYTPLVGPDILSGVLEAATGQSVFDFANENLFEPLGISVGGSLTFESKEEQMAFYGATDMSCWVSDSKGVNAAGWGLTLTACDMAKIGRLYLDGGRVDGRRIVSEDWIDVSTRKHSRWEDQKLSYGYLWWIIDESEGACAAVGDGGNVIYFNRKRNIVVAVASLFERSITDRVDFIREYVEPIF